jgi:hypothetical protein
VSLAELQRQAMQEAIAHQREVHEIEKRKAETELHKAQVELETQEMIQRHISRMITQDRNPLAN